MNTSLKFNVELTKRDIMKARLLVYFRNGIGIFFLIGGIIATAVGLSMKTEDYFFWFRWFPAFLGILGIPLSVAFAGINGQGIKKILVPLKYEFSDVGFCFCTPSITANVKWAEILRAYEFSQYIVLTTHDALQILPKRDINADALTNLRSLLRGNLYKKANIKTVN